MLRTFTTAQRLTARFVQAMLLVPIACVAAPGCTGEVITEAAGSSTGDGLPNMDAKGEGCFAWPRPATTAGAGGQGGGAGGATGAGGAMTAGRAGGAGGAEAITCPAQGAALTDLMESTCGVTAVTSDGIYDPAKGQCCYHVIIGGCTGRPYLVDDESRTASLRAGSAAGWTGGIAPRIEDLEPALRAQIAEAWARDGLGEHASIPSFGRFAFELLAVGAPADLVTDAHRAAIDEVNHARLCLGLASAYAGAPIEPGPFPFGGLVAIDADLARMAARVAREGCIEETAAALQVAEQLLVAQDPAVRAALAVIAEDEARHAELAWRTVAWAIRTGGAPVRAAVAAVFAAMVDDEPATRNERENPALSAHGRLSPARLEALAIHARRHVIAPSARALLDGIAEGESLTQPSA